MGFGSRACSFDAHAQRKAGLVFLSGGTNDPWPYAFTGQNILLGMLTGAISGALFGAAAGDLLKLVGAGALSGAMSSAVSGGDILQGAILGGIGAAIGYGIGKSPAASSSAANLQRPPFTPGPPPVAADGIGRTHRHDGLRSRAGEVASDSARYYIVTQEDTMDTLTVRLSPEIKTRLDKLAQATNRPRSFLIQSAVQDYLALNEWQVGAIQEGLQQANEGRLIPHKDIRKRWEGKLAHPVD